MLVRNMLCAALVGLSLLYAGPAEAGDSRFNISIVRRDDGTTLGELWYNEKIIWRIRVSSDGAEPVTGQTGAGTTVIVPDISGGQFLLKMRNQ